MKQMFRYARRGLKLPGKIVGLDSNRKIHVHSDLKLWNINISKCSRVVIWSLKEFIKKKCNIRFSCFLIYQKVAKQPKCRSKSENRMLDWQRTTDARNKLIHLDPVAFQRLLYNFFTTSSINLKGKVDFSFIHHYIFQYYNVNRYFLRK